MRDLQILVSIVRAIVCNTQIVIVKSTKTYYYSNHNSNIGSNLEVFFPPICCFLGFVSLVVFSVEK